MKSNKNKTSKSAILSFPLPLSLLGLTIISGLILSSMTVSADAETSDEVRITVPIACTMSGTGTTHAATLSPGTYSGASGSEYENGIGKTTLTAMCNDYNGFSIYAVGFTGQEYGATDLIGQSTSSTIATKAYAPGDTSSNWSMKLTKITDAAESYNPINLTIATGYDTWHAVPTENIRVAEYHANTGSSVTDTALGVKLETTYAAFIATNQPADVYNGQVKYTMVHPYNAVKPTDITCNPNAATISEAVCMQDFAGPNGDQIASTMTLEQQYTLKDKRDGKSYTVAKLQMSDDFYTERIDDYFKGCKFQCQTELYDSLPDEWKAYADTCGLSTKNCDETKRPQPEESVWMTQNLDLDLDSNVAYTNQDTDIGYDYESKQYKTATWTPSASTLTADNDASWIASNTTAFSYDPGDYYFNNTAENMREWYTSMQRASAYLQTCYSNNCEESLYNQLPNNWQTFVDTCDMGATSCNYSLIPPSPNPFYRQMILVEAYAYACTESDTCRESIYTQLDDGFKAFLNSCDESFTNCDQSLLPSESNYVVEAPIIDYGDANFHLGNYYNWTAAIAMNDSGIYNTDDVALVEQSICPSGWTIPRLSETNDSFGALWEAYGFYNDMPINEEGEHLKASPIFFIPSGRFDGTLSGVGSSGYFWSSMTSAGSQTSSGFASYIESEIFHLNPWNSGERSNGFPVRCVARPVGHFEHAIVAKTYSENL